MQGMSSVYEVNGVNYGVSEVNVRGVRGKYMR